MSSSSNLPAPPSGQSETRADWADLRKAFADCWAEARQESPLRAAVALFTFTAVSVVGFVVGFVGGFIPGLTGNKQS
jgi:hypothetical protein